MRPLGELLDEKKALKKRTPTFRRQESHKRKRLGDGWRKPRGVQSKLRLRRRGKPSMVSIGYRSMAVLRNKDEQGRTRIIIHNLSDISNFDSKINFAVLSARVGGRKKIAIFEQAKKLKISFLLYHPLFIA